MSPLEFLLFGTQRTTRDVSFLVSISVEDSEGKFRDPGDHRFTFNNPRVRIRLLNYCISCVVKLRTSRTTRVGLLTGERDK